MITAKFKLTGLSKLHNEHYMAASISRLDVEETIPSAIKGSREMKDALWNYCHGDWKDEKIAVVECDYLTDDGIPINPSVISIELSYQSKPQPNEQD